MTPWRTSGAAARANRGGRAVLALLFLGALALPAIAAAPAANPAAATLTVANRDIVVFRATLLGSPPAERVERANARLDALEYSALVEPVKAYPATMGELTGVSILVGDRVAFSLLSGDLDPEDRVTLAQAG